MNVAGVWASFDPGAYVKARIWVNEDRDGKMRVNDFHITQYTSSLRGQVVLLDYVGDPATVPVTVEIREKDSVTALETHIVHVATDGSYSFSTALRGTYDVTAKASHWLRSKQTVNLSGATAADFCLVNGDCDGDNEVTVADLAVLLGVMDARSGDSGWDARGDLDGDGEVTSTDLAIALAAIDQGGVPALPVEGTLSLSRYAFYRGDNVTGTLLVRNISGMPVTGRLVAVASVDGVAKMSYALATLQTPLAPGEARLLNVQVPNDLDEGLYTLTACYDENPPQAMSAVQFASMGNVPPAPLTAANFLAYSEPLYLMIGYVKDGPVLQQDFAGMKRSGHDLVCLEWFWNMVDRGQGQPNDFSRLDRVIRLADQAGLKYWMYYGLWTGNPDWTAKGVDENGTVSNSIDVWDASTRQGLIRLFEETALHLRDNATVIGHTIRLFADEFRDHSLPYRAAWTAYIAAEGYDSVPKIRTLYGNVPDTQIFDEEGRVRVPGRAYSTNPATGRLWRLYLKFKEYTICSLAAELCQAIRRYDSVKPIRLNLAQSYEAECNECPGYSQIGFYQLAEQYGGVVNQECFEYPYHASKEPPLAAKYGVYETTEGGGVPMEIPAIASLFAHAGETDPAYVAYVAYCHWLVRTELFEWFKYKPFYKLRKNYRRVYDNLTVTSFWKDAWMGDETRGMYFQYHFSFNLGLVRSRYEFDMINEDLLARGKMTPGSVLLDTNSFFLGDEVCRSIRDFVRGGGVFVANHLTGVNTIDGGEAYLLLRKYLNVKLTPDVHGKVIYKGRTTLTDRHGFRITPGANDYVIARWVDGTVAAAVRKVGAGKLLVIGFSIEADDHENGVVDDILKLAGVRRHITSDATEAGLADNGKGGYFVTLLNGKDRPVEVRTAIHGLPASREYRVTDLMNQRTEKVRTDEHGTLTVKTPVEESGCNFVDVAPVR